MSFFCEIQNEKYRSKMDEKLPQFRSLFKVLFLDGCKDKERVNVNSWVNAIAQKFDPIEELLEKNTFLKSAGVGYLINFATNILREIGLPEEVINNADNQKAVGFWILLIWIYDNLRLPATDWNKIQTKTVTFCNKRNYSRDDNIFAFMKTQKIDEVRAIIVGNDPAPNQQSTGFAFHGVNCESTRNLIDFLAKEISIMFVLEQQEVEKLKEMCDLGGWIDQNVLLMNSILTYRGNGNSNSPESWGWMAITNFFIKYLDLNCEGLVFILAGTNASEKAKLINRTRNKVLELYHPCYTKDWCKNSGNNWNTTKDWSVVHPFMRSNFLLYQMHNKNAEKMIDWLAVQSNSIPQNGRKKKAKLDFDWFDMMLGLFLDRSQIKIAEASKQ